MKLKTLAIAALLAFPTFACADDAIYVVRPSVPGVTAGVLPKTAFTSSASTPSDPGTPVTTPTTPTDPDPALIYRSYNYGSASFSTTFLEATVKLGDTYHYKSPISGPNLYCVPWDDETDSLGNLSWFYQYQESTGEKLQFLAPDKFGTSNYRKPATYLFLMDCQTNDLKTNTHLRSFENLKIVTTK